MEKKRIIALGIATLSFITAAAVTSTVAWYTGSSYLTISDINVKVKNPELSISIDGNNYVNKLTNDELMEVGKFRSISSMFSDEWLDQKLEVPEFKRGFVSGDQYVFNKITDVKEAEGGYFSQQFYIKSDIDAYITLDTALTSFKPDEAANQALLDDEAFMRKMEQEYPSLSGDALIERIENNLNNVVKSLRLSILVLDDDATDAYDDYAYYIIDPYKDKETYLGGVLDTMGIGYFDTYNHKEVLYGEVYSTNPNKTVEECIVYDDPLEEETVVAREDRTCFNARNYAGDRKINLEESMENGLEIKKENSIGIEEVEEKVLIPVASNKSTRLVLSFYQEGWDLENTDFIRYSHFIVNVLFKIAPVMPRF